MRVCLVTLCTLLAAAPTLAADKPAADRHRAHQHGAARLHVVLEGRELHIALEGPADNFLGFEHAPKTAEQKNAVARAEQRLKEPGQLFPTPAAAECQAQPARVEMKLPPPGSREAHSEIEAEWRWQCAQPGALATIDVGLFKAFPRLKELRVQVVTTQGQKSVVLKPKAARLKLAS